MNSVPYAPALGSLMYAMVATQLDISHAVGVKHVFRYLADTKDLCTIPTDRTGTQIYAQSRPIALERSQACVQISS